MPLLPLILVLFFAMSSAIAQQNPPDDAEEADASTEMASTETNSEEADTSTEMTSTETDADEPPPLGTAERSTFATGIQGREPVDKISSMTNDRHKVYFFSEINGMTNQTIVHRWIYNDEIKAEVPFNIKGGKWRTYSSKNLMPSWTGTWTVEITTKDGRMLSSHELEYTAAATQAEPMPEQPQQPQEQEMESAEEEELPEEEVG